MLLLTFELRLKNG